MNENEKLLRRIIEAAANDAGERYGRFRRRYHVDDLFSTVLEEDDGIALIAAKTLVHLCTDGDETFNNNTIGLKAVLQFLAERSTDGPEDEDSVVESLRDLRGRAFTEDDLLE